MKKGGVATSLLLPKTPTGREQSTFSVWSSPGWTRRHFLMAAGGARRIAALELWVEVNSGRVCLSLVSSLHRRCGCGEEFTLLLLDKRRESQSLIAGWRWRKARYRYRCRPSIVLSMADGKHQRDNYCYFSYFFDCSRLGVPPSTLLSRSKTTAPVARRLHSHKLQQVKTVAQGLGPSK